ncbi:hypothetical protein [Embleya sp. NPDC001921]
MTTPKLTTVNTVYRAWWHDFEGWDGAATYADLDTAKTHATADYVREENVPEDEVAGLNWRGEGRPRWELFEGDDATPVYVYAERVLGPAGASLKGRAKTPDVVKPGGSRTIRVQRCCNGCGLPLGDVTDAEMKCAGYGDPLPDVRDECPDCSTATAAS